MPINKAIPVFDTYLDYFATRALRAGTIQGLTVDGAQYTEAGTAPLVNIYGTAFWGTINPKQGGSILWVEFGLTAGLKAAASATADLKVQWQAKNKGSATWVLLHPEFSTANINTTNVDRTWSGYYAPEPPYFTTVPFEIMLLVQASEASEGVAKVKSSSYARVCFETITDITIPA